MALPKPVYYAALAIGILVLVRIGLSLVTALFGIVWSIATTIVSLLLVVAIVYAVVKGALWLRGGDETGGGPADSVETDSGDSIDQLTERYVEGELSEAELERRIERELETDSLDRELNRDRELDRSN